jgi:hypothetical protein
MAAGAMVHRQAHRDSSRQQHQTVVSLKVLQAEPVQRPRHAHRHRGPGGQLRDGLLQPSRRSKSASRLQQQARVVSKIATGAVNWGAM